MKRRFAMQRTINGTTVELVKGDIAGQSDMDSVVNAANAWLRTGGGVAGRPVYGAGHSPSRAQPSIGGIHYGVHVRLTRYVTLDQFYSRPVDRPLHGKPPLHPG